MAQEIADSTLLDTWASGGNIVEPDISKIIEGWQLGEQPPHEYMNWLQNTFGSKLNHILKNGVASWNNETEYLAGSSVQHNGNVWLCKTTNTSSEPADVNTNWKRIITIEALTTVLNSYVKNSGDETIDGIKTFSSNPLSTATQSTNANALTKYSAVVKNSGNETIEGVKTFSSSPVIPNASNNNQPVALGQFTRSFTSSGYQILPSGLIIQWGIGAAQNGSDSAANAQTITYPLAFPNAVFSVSITGDVGGSLPSGNVDTVWQVYGMNLLTNFRAFANSVNISNVNGSTPFWIAIGY